MELAFLFKGLVLGFSVSAPIGPIGILCINRTINKGYFSGFVSGLGATTADFIYGIIAGLGLTVISDFLLGYRLWIQGIGLVFLLFIGFRTLIKKEKTSELTENDNYGLIHDYLTTFFLTITNPLAILLFVAVFAGLGLSGAGADKFRFIPLLLGVLVGSGSWWLILSGVTYKLKDKLGIRVLKKIDLISGLLIIGCGILISLELIYELI